jgi:hypothetical protein
MTLIYTSQKSIKKPQNTKKRQENKKSWEELCESLGVKAYQKSKKKFMLLKKDPLQVVNELNAHRSLAHLPSPHVIIPKVKDRIRYEGEMAEREARAQIEIEAKKKRVGILYNKGPYGFLSPGINPKDLGRK